MAGGVVGGGRGDRPGYLAAGAAVSRPAAALASRAAMGAVDAGGGVPTGCSSTASAWPSRGARRAPVGIPPLTAMALATRRRWRYPSWPGDMPPLGKVAHALRG